jgi:RNA polymerase-binding transcription factor DksA
MDLDSARRRLLAERERLMRIRDGSADALDEMEERGGEFAGSDQRPVDSANQTFERERERSVIESLERQLALVDDALGRIDEGSYGRCAVCGLPIGQERLAARPMARFCVRHQQEAERRAQAEAGLGDAGDPTV